jgi:hypothetical protein
LAIVVVLLLWVDYVPIWYAMWSWWGSMDFLGKGILELVWGCTQVVAMGNGLGGAIGSVVDVGR